MSLKERAIEARLAAGYKTVPPFAAAVGIKPAAVYMIESGKTKSLKSDTLAAYAKLSGLLPDWIRTGGGPKRIAERSVVAEQRPDYGDSRALAAQLLSLATPRSKRALETIIEAAESGLLSEADVELLGAIAKRFQGPGV